MFSDFIKHSIYCIYLFSTFFHSSKVDFSINNYTAKQLKKIISCFNSTCANVLPKKDKPGVRVMSLYKREQRIRIGCTLGKIKES